MSLQVPGRAGAFTNMVERQPNQPQPIPEPQHISPEGGNGAPGIQPTLNERANPPPESPSQGGNESPCVQRESNIDELLSKLQQRDEKRSRRPIQLYRTAYDEERDRLLHDKTINTPEAKRVREERSAQIEEIKRLRDDEFPERPMISYDEWKRQYDEWDQQVKDKHINALKTRRSISERINFALSIFKVEYLLELKQQDAETLGPILRGIAKRNARLDKAERAIERILLQRRSEEQSQGER